MLVGTVNVERNGWRENKPTSEQIEEASTFVKNRWPEWDETIRERLICSFSNLLSIGIPLKRIKTLISIQKDPNEAIKVRQVQNLWTRIYENVAFLFESENYSCDYLSEQNIKVRTLCELGLSVSFWDRTSTLYFKRTLTRHKGKVERCTCPYVLSPQIGLYVIPEPRGVFAEPIRETDPMLVRRKDPNQLNQDNSQIVIKVPSFHKKTGRIRSIFFQNFSQMAEPKAVDFPAKEKNEKKISPISIMTELKNFDAFIRNSLTKNNEVTINSFLNAFHILLDAGITIPRLTYLLKNNDQVNPFIHPIMLRTLRSVGETLNQWDGTSCLYFKRVIIVSGNRYYHAFCVTRSQGKVGIWYMPEYEPYIRNYSPRFKQETHSPGTFKDIAPAYPLMEEGVALVRKKPLMKKELVCQQQLLKSKDFIAEEELLKLLHKIARQKNIIDSQYWVPPYWFKCVSQNVEDKKITPIYFQPKFPNSLTVLNDARFPQVVDVFLGFARGLGALHAIGYVHGDPKILNLLYDHQSLLCDFGLTKQIGEKEYSGTFPSPEELSNFGITGLREQVPKFPAQDCFALGVSLVSYLCALMQKYKNTGWETLYTRLSTNSDKSKFFKYYGLIDHKWQILCICICTDGVTDELEKFLDRDLMNSNLWNRSDENERNKLRGFLNIGFKLLTRDPLARISCTKTVELIEQLKS